MKEANAGDLVKVRLTIVVPETSYYVLVTDPLPAGLEGVNGSLNTTTFTERPPNPFGIDASERGQRTSDSVVLALGSVRQRGDARHPDGALRQLHEPRHLRLRILRPRHHAGQYLALPPTPSCSYYPDVFGHSDGGAFTVK